MTTVEHSVDARAQAGGVKESTAPDPEVPERARGPRRYSAKYKARILEEYEALGKADKGALLRREGLYSSLISEWRKQRDRGALEALAKPAGRPRDTPRKRSRSSSDAVKPRWRIWLSVLIVVERVLRLATTNALIA
jgi:transposase-like protein